MHTWSTYNVSMNSPSSSIAIEGNELISLWYGMTIQMIEDMVYNSTVDILKDISSNMNIWSHTLVHKFLIY